MSLLPSAFARSLCFSLLFLCAAIHPSFAHDFKGGDVAIDHPWSRATPEGAKVAVGYLIIRNGGSTPDRLVAATAEIAGKAELHEMAVDANGVMTMRPLDGGLEIPAGAEVALKPGSFHLMFMDLSRQPKVGETFAGTLMFEKAGTIAIEYSVDQIGGQTEHGGHGG